jgi:methionine-rich copper-binding protein CopC
VKLTRVAACMLMILPAWPAQAHVHLRESTPANGSTLQAAPPRLQLVFSEAARLTALSIRAKGEGAAHKLAPLPAQTAASFTIDLPPLAPGSYTIEWRALSDDHHIASGTVSFAVQTRPGP